jgi:hypothetical protein
MWKFLIRLALLAVLLLAVTLTVQAVREYRDDTGGVLVFGPIISSDGDGYVTNVERTCDGAEDEKACREDLESLLGAMLGGVDCDDYDPTVSPSMHEVCDDSIDNDCDGQTDEKGCAKGISCPAGASCDACAQIRPALEGVWTIIP